MQQYIGTKIIKAMSMTAHEAATTLGRAISGEDEKGYLVEYSDGYKSWSPAKAFEEAYRPCDAMTFGLALDALKSGHLVARVGWNGKGMWLSMVASDSYSLNNPNYVATPEFQGQPHLLPWIGMKTVDNGFVPWLASQTDVLANDWCIVDEG